MADQDKMLLAQDAYVRYRKGDKLSDGDIELLLITIDAALPYLNASSDFALVRKEALYDVVQLKTLKTHRSMQ